jgi:hypothetical protein
LAEWTAAQPAHELAAKKRKNTKTRFLRLLFRLLRLFAAILTNLEGEFPHALVKVIENESNQMNTEVTCGKLRQIAVKNFHDRMTMNEAAKEFLSVGTNGTDLYLLRSGAMLAGLINEEDPYSQMRGGCGGVGNLRSRLRRGIAVQEQSPGDTS